MNWSSTTILLQAQSQVTEVRATIHSPMREPGQRQIQCQLILRIGRYLMKQNGGVSTILN